MADRTDDPAAAPPRPREAPVPRKKRTSPHRVVPRERRHGLPLVHAGDGKGKTTAALADLAARPAGTHVVVTGRDAPTPSSPPPTSPPKCAS